MKVNSLVEVLLSDKMINVKPLKSDKLSKSMWGTVRSNINNTIIGVSKGYSKKLEINGVGYRASTSGEKLQLNLGFSHPVEIKIPNGLADYSHSFRYYANNILNKASESGPHYGVSCCKQSVGLEDEH